MSKATTKIYKQQKGLEVNNSQTIEEMIDNLIWPRNSKSIQKAKNLPLKLNTTFRKPTWQEIQLDHVKQDYL